MKVQDIMRRRFPRACPEDTLQCAAAMLRDEETNILPICQGETLVGIVTERDIVVQGAARGVDPVTTLLEEIMESSTFYCFQDQDCQVARQLMLENHVERLPVTDGNKRLVGMVMLTDLCACQNTAEVPYYKSW